MSESAHPHAGPSDDSPCYNCGGRGHWVVACPEPTRKTPAGLANAWRNAPNAGQGNHRQHHGGSSKRVNKGPIITKYAPPPPPPPPPPSHPSSLSHGTASYPPPGPPYPQQNAQFQAPYAHYPPAAHYPAGYGPAYPPQQYHQPSYGTAPAAQAGYAAHPPGPPASQPPAPYPAAYPSYPPAGPSSAPGYPPQTPFAQSYPQPPYGLPPVPYPVHSGPHYPPPPKPPHVSRPHSGLNQPVHHSLPPKPPRSVHTQQEPHRDHRNRRKHDRQNKHRDNRRRDQGSRHRSSQQKMQNKNNRSNRGNRSNPRSSQKALASTNADNTKGAPLSSVEDLEKNAKLGSEAPKEGFREDSTATEIPASDKARAYGHEDDQSRQSISGELDDDSETADSESGESTDGDEPEPARTLISDDEAVSAQGDGHPSQNPQDHGKDETSTSGSLAPDMSHPNGKHKRRDDESEDERQPKKSKATSSLAHGGLKDAEEDNQTEAQHDTESAIQGDDVPTVEEEEDGPILPPLDPESRGRSKEGHQRPKSRNSSVSSRSSDLNSLEAELLGRPAKQRSPDDIGLHQRQDRVAMPKMQRRRQPNADSAYSRRW
ncbi:hypothetical protein TrVFT333_007714 [Trichoderma virens FT-333]|nr:hypothetical protein TrVFT333_007714 [Trichoderma virens FT-333]